MDKLLSFLRAHHIECWPNADGTIGAVEHYTINGIGGYRDVVTIQANAQAVRDWLGY